MRLIDADALPEMEIERFDTTDAFEVKLKCAGRNHMRKIINDAPTIDAVPVVRCEDCKHHEVCKNGVNGWCNEHERPTDVTYFCADGERRRDEQQ